jgi:ATPase subunit of ABC transporter with duplicated ATPase domains
VALVSLNAVRKSFGSRTVLDGLDFAIEPGARVGVVGANGSGKSTMLKLIAGLEEPDAGTSVRRRGLVVSFLPQHPLGDERTPLETVVAARPDLAELDDELHAVAAPPGAPPRPAPHHR